MDEKRSEWQSPHLNIDQRRDVSGSKNKRTYREWMRGGPQHTRQHGLTVESLSCKHVSDNSQVLTRTPIGHMQIFKWFDITVTVKKKRGHVHTISYTSYEWMHSLLLTGLCAMSPVRCFIAWSEPTSSTSYIELMTWIKQKWTRTFLFQEYNRV